MSDKPELVMKWCDFRRAQFACRYWHYSKTMSTGRNYYIGIVEDKVFIGVIIFGLGAGNATNGKPYGLPRSGEMLELTRVALRRHKTPVSQMIAIAIKMLKQREPKVRLLISMADTGHNHHGGIYQAGNWIYTGTTATSEEYFIRGRAVHTRTMTKRKERMTYNNKAFSKPLNKRKTPHKHRYLMPLDKQMRKLILPMALPYPKRVDPANG